MNFDRAFELLIGHEGGYTNNPNDNGNWTGGQKGKGVLKGTKYGIAANTYPNLDIKNLTLPQAKEIYRRDFWGKVRCDDLPVQLRFQIFDMAVNSGNKRAVMLLQAALGFTGKNVDGIFGQNTLNAVHQADGNALVLCFSAERLDFYTGLSSWVNFGKGWTRRVASSLRTAVKG